MAILFITGTGTDVGKTTASLSILSYLNEQNLNQKKIAYYKPIQCGLYQTKKKQWVGDKGWIQNRLPNHIDFYEGQVFKTPASPHYAAKQENTSVNIPYLKKKMSELSRQYDILLVEGAGGLWVPLNEQGDILIDSMPLTTQYPTSN